MVTIVMDTQGATEGVDWAQKLTRPKHAFSGRELPREQRFIVSFRRVRQGRSSKFQKKLLGYLVTEKFFFENVSAPLPNPAK